MYRDVTDTFLLAKLSRRRRDDLHAKILELRQTLHQFLAASRETFPHYTSHAVDHSDEIVRSMSAVLERAAVGAALELSSTEIYLLLLAAYLHDAGMVVSEEEKLRALGTREWQYFLRSDDAHAAKHDEIQNLRSEAQQRNDDALSYQADLRLRLLIAEYFRVQHAGRAVLAINEALAVPRDFLESDPVAARTVAAVCIGHGLTRADLMDDREYPTRRTVFGDEVNVRLLSMLLRIGDLLDMRFARACPLMANAASPLPAKSVAHWAQYGDITDRLVSNEEIRIEATCNNVDEHRLLRDWCQWLSDEVQDAPRLLVGSPRHGGWRPPQISLVEPRQTIRIDRAPGATYRVIDWRFEIDRDEILLRLVHDANPHHLGFVQELVQNALDATRTVVAAGLAVSERPEIEVLLSTNSEGEITSVLVEDHGIGMTETIIEQYLLQVGRSWYQSAEFRSAYSFSPTSRFGIGFMSCFAVSDDVVVTTRHARDAENKAVRLRIPGPRNYLAAEDVTRSSPGTSVEVRLREPVDEGAVLALLRGFCRANEHPIVVSVDGTPVAHLPQPFVPDWLETPKGDATVARRTVSWNDDGVVGEASFFVLEVEGREWWDPRTYYLRNDLVVPVDVGPSWLALNGLRHDADAAGRDYASDVSVRVNVQRRLNDVGLNRDQVSLRDFVGPLEATVEQHLETVPFEEYRYRERVARKFEYRCSPGWRDRVPATRRVFSTEGVRYLSELEVLSVDRVGIIWVDQQEHELLEYEEQLEDEQIALASQCECPTLTGGDLRHGVGLGLALNIQQDYEPVGFRRLGEFSGGLKGWSLDLSPRERAAKDWLAGLVLSKTVPFQGGSRRLVGLKTPLFFSMVLWNADCPVISDLEAMLQAHPSLNSVVNTKLPGVFNKTADAVVPSWLELLQYCFEQSGAESVGEWSNRDFRYDAATASLWIGEPIP
jgi:hypothetical protein